MEAVGSLKAAQTLDTALLDSAKAQQALTSEAAVQAKKDLLALIDPEEQGKHQGNGMDAPSETASMCQSGSVNKPRYRGRRHH
ncbi:hypothetical protein, partial [Pseudoduganella umbonata]